MTSTNEVAQKSFNPSWMQAASPLKMPKNNGMHRTSNEEDDMEMMDPIFAKHRYGREDILALIPKDSTAPPEGLHKCPFFVDKPLTPIILTGLNETELRLQQNINSSKALSAFNLEVKTKARTEWQGKDNDGSNSPQTNNPWTIAGSSRSGSSFRGTSNRWQSNTNEGNRSTKTYSGFGRPGYGAGNNGPDKRPVKNAWTDSNGGYKPRQHLKSGSEEAPRTEDTEPQPKASESNDWSSAWRSNDSKFSEKQKSAEPGKTQSTFNRASEIAKNDPKENIWASTLHNSVWTPPSSLEKPNNNLTHSAPAASLEQNERSKVTPIQPSPAEFLEPDQWYYLDPQDTQRGPFSSEQMQAWFTNGYFQSDLRIRFGSKDFSTLGDLIKQNGALTPFTNSKSVEASPSPSIIPSSVPASASWTSEPVKSQQEQAKFGNHSIDTLKLLEVKERLIIEEQRKLQEKEELLKREERERAEKNASLLAMQRQLEIQRQEIENRAREQERELEIRRLQILEYEREQREKLEKLEQERKLQLQQEELNRRRLAEMQLAQEEKLRQELLMQAELKQQEERRKLELRLQKEEAEKAVAAERLRIQNEKLAEYERQKAQILAQQQQAQAQALAQQQQQAQALAQQQQQAQALAQQRLIASKAAPWSAASGKLAKAAQFSEIQEQEKLEDLRRQQLEEEKRRESEVAQKRSGAAAQNNGNPWNVVKTTAKPVPIPPAKESQPKPSPAKVQKKSPVKEPKKVDPLTDWVVQRISQMNSNVDSEVFAPFLIDMQDPNEIEDYILSYFGETKAAKQFHQDFLAKRIELRPRRGVKKEDDLSSPAQASDGANIPGNSGAKGGKKSKKGKKVDLTSMMSFRPVGDATRFNAGEIDLDIPAASKKGKKK